MTREQLEHVLRAAADIAQADELIVIGSQAILGQFPDAPPSLRVSVEVALSPRHHVERADLIDGTIGEPSPFHEAYGHYAQGVSPETAVLPAPHQTRSRRRHQAPTSTRCAKWSSGAVGGSAMPAASAIVLSSNSASATCSGHGRWWTSTR